QAVPLLGHREQRLRKKFQPLDMDAEFPSARAEQIPLGANDVADIQPLKQREITGADGIASHVNLELLAVLRQVRESGLPLAADGFHASSDAYFQVRGKLFGRLRTVRRQDSRNRVREIVPPPIGAITHAFDFAYSRPALAEQLIFQGQSGLLWG